MNINLHIERLVLDDLPIDRHQGNQIRLSVEIELTRLFAEQHFASQLTSGFSVPAVMASNIHVDAKPDSAKLGVQIAQSVYGGIGQ